MTMVMKKTILVSLAICLLLTLLCGAAMAETPVEKQSQPFAKTPSFVSWLYGPTNVRVSSNGLTGKVTWSRDSSGNATGYAVYQCYRSAYKPSNTPYGWYTGPRSDGYYWYPVKLLGTTSGTSFSVKASSAGTYYIEVDSYYISPSYYISSRGGFGTFHAVNNSVSAPKSLKATQTGKNKVKLTWSAGENAKSYAIYRKQGSGSYKKIGTTKKLSYVDKKAKNGKKYQYKVQAVNGSKTKFSKAVKAYPMAQPGSVKAKKAKDGTITVTWKKVKGAKTYQIYEKTPTSGSFTKIGTIKKTKARLAASSGNGTYRYYIIPAVGSFQGQKSKTAAVTITTASNPGTPSSTTYRAILLSNTYSSTSNALPMCDDDRYAMENTLKNLGATSYTITTQKNSSASGMESAIRSVFSQADDDDVTILYYTGHGLNSNYSSNIGALCGNDGNSFIYPYQLRNILDQYKGTKVILLNSCHSGAMIGKDADAKALARQINSSFIQAFYSPAEKSSNNLAASGYYVLTACKTEQTGIGVTNNYTGDRYSIFTKGLVEGLGWDMLKKTKLALKADTNSDNQVTLAECYRYTRDAVDEMESYFNSNYNWGMAMDVQVYPTNCSLVFFAR